MLAISTHVHAGIFFLGYACFQVPATILCARVGAPAFMSVSLAAWGLVASSFAALKHKAQFYIMRFVLGLCETGAYPGTAFRRCCGTKLLKCSDVLVDKLVLAQELMS